MGHEVASGLVGSAVRFPICRGVEVFASAPLHTLKGLPAINLQCLYRVGRVSVHNPLVPDQHEGPGRAQAFEFGGAALLEKESILGEVVEDLAHLNLVGQPVRLHT